MVNKQGVDRRVEAADAMFPTAHVTLQAKKFIGAGYVTGNPSWVTWRIQSKTTERRRRRPLAGRRTRFPSTSFRPPTRTWRKVLPGGRRLNTTHQQEVNTASS